jgi:leader peptidase (prepilin peptidase) / N-methyltransferase
VASRIEAVGTCGNTGIAASGLWAVAVVVASAACGVPAGAGARVLLGRLRRGAQVPPPWCELAVAAGWAGTGAAWMGGLLPLEWLPALMGLGWLAVAAGAVDVRHRRLPDALTLPALPAAVLLLLPVGMEAAVRGMLGAALAVAVHAAVYLVVPGAVGAGDVKLAAPLGAVLAAAAWPALAFAAVLAAALTAVVAVVVAVVAPAVAPAGGAAAATVGAVPHGPSMLAATWMVTAWLVGPGAAAGGGGG